MKTREAFALRDFNPAAILQQKFFRTRFKLLNATDDETNLDELFNPAAVAHLGSKEMQERLHEAERLKKIVAVYTKRLLNHELKLEKFLQRELDDATHARAWILQQSYLVAINLCGKLQARIGQLIRDGRKTISKMFDAEFGERIQAARELIGMSRDELSFQLGFSLNTVGQYERGERQPTPLTIVQMCEILGRTPNQLFGFS